MADTNTPTESEDHGFKLVDEDDGFKLVDEDDVQPSTQDSTGYFDPIGYLVGDPSSNQPPQTSPTTLGEKVSDFGYDLSTQGPFTAVKNAFKGNQTEADIQAELDKAYDSTKPYSSTLDHIKAAVILPMATFMDAFAVPQAMILGPSSRLFSGLEEGATYKESSLLGTQFKNPGISMDWDKFKHGILNPEYIQEMRKRNGLPADFNEAWDIISQEGPLAQASFVMQEFLPTTGEPADIGYAKQQIEESVKGIEDPDMKNIARAAGRLSWNIGLDPMSYLTFGSLPVIKAGSTSGQVKNAAKEIELAMEIAKAEAATPGSKSLEALAKDRGLLRLKFPFVKKEIPVYEGEEVAKALDHVSSFIEARTGIRQFSQRVGMETHDATSQYRDFLTATATTRLQKISDFFKNSPMSKDYNVLKYASDLAQHGDEWGPEVYKATRGVPLSGKQMEEAQKIKGFVQKSWEDATDFFQKTTGRKIRKISPKNLKEVEIPEGMDPNKYILTVDGKQYNYMQQNAYGFGRRMRPDLDIQTGNEAARDFDSFTNSFNLKTSASSIKHRVNLSDTAAEDYMRSKYGVDYFYDKNIPQTIFDKTAELYHLAIDTGYAQSMKKAYGVERDGIQAFIDAASIRVANTKIPALAEDLIISKMRPSDFKTIDHAAFDTMKYVVGKEDAGLLFPKDLYYPKQVADSISARFNRPSDNSLLRAVGWWQNAKAKNILSGAFRLPKQAIDNIAAASMAGMPVGSLMRETVIAAREAATGKISEITKEFNLIPSLSETMTNLGDFKGPFKVNKTILTNEELLNLPDAYVDSVHALAKSGKNNLREWTEVGKDIINFPTDNKLSKFVRAMGNSADVVTKRAYYRVLRERGYNPVEAAEAVNNVFMDFTKTSKTIKGLRYINPFISFQIKNMERLVKLGAATPIGIQILNPNRGYLKRAIEDSAGWDPVVSRRIQKEIPMIRDGALSFVLRGAKDIEEDVSNIRQLANKYYLAYLPEEQRENFLAKGGVLNARWYDPVQAAGDFMDPTRMNENMFSPLTSMAIMGTAGYDPFRQKYIESIGTKYEDNDKLIEALKIANPADYKNFYAIMGKTMEVGGKFMSELFSNPLDEISRKRLELKNDSRFESLIKRDNTLGYFMSQGKFLGLGKVTVMEDNFYFHELSMMSALKKNEELANKYEQDNDVKKANMYWLRAKQIRNDIEYNQKVFQDAYDLMDKSGDKQEIPQVEMADPEDSTGNYSIPADNNEWKVVEPDREPQSEDGRNPFGKDPLEDMLNRTSDITQKYLGRIQPTERPEEDGNVDQFKATDLPPKIKPIDLAQRGPQSEDVTSNMMGDYKSFDESDPIYRALNAYKNMTSDAVKLGKKENRTKEETKLLYQMLDERKLVKKFLMDQKIDIPDGPLPEGGNFPQGPSERNREKLYHPEFPNEIPGLETGRIPDRGIAGVRAFEEAGGPGGGSSPSGPAMAVGTGAAVLAGQSKQPEMVGRGVTDNVRRLIGMSEYQLKLQPDSPDKDKALEILGYTDRNKPYASIGPMMSGTPPGYAVIPIPGDVKDSHYIGDGNVSSWVRGFSPNPDTFVVFEAQKNKKDKKGSEIKAIRAAIEYAKKAGYKNIGIADSSTVSILQGQSSPADWMKRKYDLEFLDQLSKQLGQSSSEKEWEMLVTPESMESKRYARISAAEAVHGLNAEVIKLAKEKKLSFQDAFSSINRLQWAWSNAEKEAARKSMGEAIYKRVTELYEEKSHYYNKAQKIFEGSKKVKYRVFSLEGNK